MREFLRRRLAAVIVVLLVVLLLSANRIALFLTDWWWFDSVDAGAVFTGVLAAKATIAVVFGGFLAIVIAVNLQIARRLRPIVIPATPQQALLYSYRERVDPYLKWLIGGLSLFIGLMSGLTVSSQWKSYLLWRHATPFGQVDPQFHRDIGYYVFQLPFLRSAQDWLFYSLIFVLALTVGAHLLLGGIRPDAPRDRVMPKAKIHLSVLLALVLAARGWGYWLDRFMLNFSPRGLVTGASYTDVNAELPALTLLLVVTVVAIGLVLASLWRPGFVLPGSAVALLVVASILLQGAYPALIQRVRVDPQELAREEVFIRRNLDATKVAYGLDGIDLLPFSVDNDLDQAQLDANQSTFSNVRLWDPDLLLSAYQELQALRPFYRFHDVDVDRYVIDGELRQVMLAVRELESDAVEARWQNQHLTFTHGYGVVASQVNAATREGDPEFLARDIPPRTNPTLAPDGELVPDDRPGVYFGEAGYPSFSIVRTEQLELDYEEPTTQQQVETSYEGTGGVTIGGRLRRLAFALRFSDPNFVLSGLLRNDSRVLMRRDAIERVRTVAPFLELDDDLYPVVIDGRMVWIVDGFTTSVFYPYSQRQTLNTGVRHTPLVNYIRNSVKAVVDAYDGSVTLYVVDPDDPVVQTWRKAFGGALFRDADEAPVELSAHYRYPEDLFNLQATMYQSYHIPEVDAFYSGADQWAAPRDAARLENNQNLDASQAPMRPFYVVMTLPGETEEEFVLIQPYVPKNKQNMIAWLAARSDPGHYGELLAVQFPTDALVKGPSQAHASIEQTDELSARISVLDVAGSRVIRGNQIVLPVESSLLYVEPLFIQNDQAPIPRLWQVALVLGERVVVRPTLAAALDAMVNGGRAVDFGQDTVSGGGGEPPPSEDTDDPDELLRLALQARDDAQAALDANDLGRFQELIELMGTYLDRLAAVEGVDVEETPSPEPSAAGSESAG